MVHDSGVWLVAVFTDTAIRTEMTYLEQKKKRRLFNKNTSLCKKVT